MSQERSAEWLRGYLKAKKEAGVSKLAVYGYSQMIAEAEAREGSEVTRPPLGDPLEKAARLLSQAQALIGFGVTRQASIPASEAGNVTKAQWIEMYGGQAALDREGFDVVPCVDCTDNLCHGWRVRPKAAEASVPTADEVIAAAERAIKDERSPLRLCEPSCQKESVTRCMCRYCTSDRSTDALAAIAKWKEAQK